MEKVAYSRSSSVKCSDDGCMFSKRSVCFAEKLELHTSSTHTLSAYFHFFSQLPHSRIACTLTLVQCMVAARTVVS